MHLAILGTDADILALACERELGHQIDWCGDVRLEDSAAIGRFVADMLAPNNGNCCSIGRLSTERRRDAAPRRPSCANN